MKLLMNTISSIALVLTLATTTPHRALAESTDDIKWCLDRVASCERVLDKATETLQAERDYNRVLEYQNSQLQAALRATSEELEEQEAWYRDAAIMGPVALGLGLVLGARLGAR